ncbi:cytochrome P450 [Aspergillus udagawae]|uniref:Cytochrome P450 n=1 Tax=Aspergillus udagawae TaxID=91492 RepID=A0ABQ1AU66_9EURO|nr:cytochrome P450 [Aspergillus udagawae]GFF88099.1 cytochrome P450 [Aspergillus udagawae]GFG10232.1 cytochrome P450 [Aspergillus udagawae]
MDLLVSSVQNDQYHTVGTESFISTRELDGLLIRFALDNAGLSILGRDLNTLQGQESELTSLFEMLTNSSFSKRLYFGLIDIFPRWIVRRLPLKAIQKNSGALDRLQVLCKGFVDEKPVQPVGEATQPRDVVSNLIQWEQFSPEELAFYVFMYLLLGLLWTIYLLAKNRETQSQLRKEIRARIPSGAAATYTDDAIRRVVENTPLLDAVCSESVRLYPALQRLVRIASKDSQILGTAIPKGTMILLTPLVINRSPYLWGADAEEFNAYRWIDSKTGAFTHRGGAVQDHCMMSFGQGQTACVGKEYGLAEMKVFIAVLLSTLDIELVEPAKAVFPDSIGPHKPVDDIKLRVRKV